MEALGFENSYAFGFFRGVRGYFSEMPGGSWRVLFRCDVGPKSLSRGPKAGQEAPHEAPRSKPRLPLEAVK